MWGKTEKLEEKKINQALDKVWAALLMKHPELQV